jgi:AcrR family transcriptional regulator
MKKQPVNAISTQEIASKAGVSTATVYRWWPTKEALLLDAFLHIKEKEVPFPEHGTPLERMHDHAISSAKFLGGEDGRVAARMIAAIQDDDKLREAFTEKLYLPQSNRMLQVGQEAVAAGELPPGTDVRFLCDMFFGSCLVRILMRHERVEQADAERAFDLAVAGAWAYWRGDRATR